MRMASQDCNAASNEDSVDFTILLKSAFQTFHFWRGASSDKAWALEKIKDVLIKELGRNPYLLKREIFVPVVKGFFDDGGDLLQYPDFVMIEVSRMIAEMILKCSPEIEEEDLKSMCKLLRSVVSHGQLDKGQRVSAMFECMHKLLINGTARIFGVMMSYDFDATFALLFAIAGTQNYTRKSASTYLIELVKFAHSDPQSGDCHEEVRAALKDILSSLFQRFNLNLMQSYETSFSPHFLNIIANYCRLLTSCMKNCPQWGFSFMFSGSNAECTFNIWCKLLQKLNTCLHSDAGDITVPSIEQLTVLASQRSCSKDREAAFGMISTMILTDFTDPNSAVGMSDMVMMAYSVVSRCGDALSSSSKRALIDLSILPVLVVLDVQLMKNKFELFAMIDLARRELEGKSVTKQSYLLNCAMRNAFSLYENDIKGLVNASNFTSALEYVTFKTNEPLPDVSRPLLIHGMVTTKHSLTCLLCGFKIIKTNLENPSGEFKVHEAENIQNYIAPVINYRGISHKDLTTTLDCYKTFLHHLVDSPTLVKRECVKSVLEGLELHLVNMDPNVREVAMKGLGQLCLLDIAVLKEEVITCKTLPSMWKCVKDKEENVVSQVFEFLFQIAKSRETGKLKEILTHMQINEDDLKTELQNCLLSSQWELIKPVAFSLLSFISDLSNVIRYAEVCIHQSCCLAVPVVFNFIDKQMKRWTEESDKDTLEARVDGLCDLLQMGWGDLVLAVVNGENTTSLRCAVDILMSVNQFLTRMDVSDIVDNKLKHCIQADVECGLMDRMTKLKMKMVQYSKQVLRGSPFLELVVDTIQHPMSNEMKVLTESQNDESKEETINMEENGVDNVSVLEHIDTTVERQPLLLSDKSFPLPEMVHSVVETCAEKSQSYFNFFLLTGFRELLNQLPLIRLLKEAHRSTDEYERNSATILHDVNELMESSFKGQTKRIEKEVVDVLLQELLKIVEKMLNHKNEDDCGEFLNFLTELYKKVEIFYHSKTMFFKFMFLKRRSAVCKQFDDVVVEFNSDFFDNGLKSVTDHFQKGVTTKDYFSSNDGIKQLLDIYLSCKADKESISVDRVSNIDNEFLQVLEMENDSKCSSELGSDASCFLEEKEPQLFHTAEEIQKAVDDLKNSKTAESMCLTIEMVEKWVRTCINIIKTGRKDLTLLDLIFTSLEQIKEWRSEDLIDGFDRDGDNDPSMIDCY